MIHARTDYTERVQDSANIIPQDEPVFLMRGQDKHAISTLLFYIDQVKHEPNFDQQVVDSLTKHLEAIRNWQEVIKVKTPDMPPMTSTY